MSEHDIIYILIIILSVIGFIFVLFIIIRIVLFLLLRFLSRRYKINKAKRIKFLKRQAEKIDKEKQRTEYNDLKIGKGLQHKEQEKIVGFVKPVGFWSSLLLGEKLTDVFNNSKKISIENSKQFWETVAETQARESIRNKKDK